MNTPSLQKDTQPWWKYGHLWMVIGGPVVVILASMVTVYLAVRTPDPVYVDDRAEPRAATQGNADTDLTPAMQARNHAATGGIALKPEESTSATKGANKP
ncbi:nitrogen fixation protein FixH [Ottowia sp.]|uniref:nitrogen fixation protein FixH n=1 Tax=Ottowia sp. TaxID=1898956 RepID=UPI003A85F6A9